ncbi:MULTISPECIES: sensor histidine kinase [unclassified Cupriavidus]|uniref:sensor histidine kinase n=1 Tax=unclassified Cupriavidus TaxID=2640874 RepID=UPI00313D0548
MARMLREPAIRPSPLLIAVAGATALTVFAFDAFTPYQVAVAVLYVVVVQIVAATGSLRLTAISGLLCVALTLLALLLTYDPEKAGGALARCSVSLLALVTATVLSLRHLRNSECLREQVHLLNLSHDAIVIYDLDGVVRFWNAGAQALYGWTASDAIGNDFHALTQTRFPGGRQEVYSDLMRDGRWEGELERVHRDGRTLAVASRIALWRDRHGQPIAIMATNNDITERRRTEEELERSQTYLADAQRLSKTGSVLRYANSHEARWSEECYRILDYSPDTPPSLDLVLQRTHPEDIELVLAMDQAIRDGKPLIDGTHRLLMGNGELKHVRFVARLKSAPGHRQPEYVGALMDITAVVAAQEALQRSMSELAHVMRLTTLGGLATTIAHEVTQPLAAIVTCGDSAVCWLDRPEPDVLEALISIRQMIHDAQRSTDIVRQIRAMAQRRTPQSVAVSINALVNDALRLVGRECRSAHVSLSVDLPQRDVVVRGDPVQLQQVLVNLLMNAIQAMAEVSDRPRRLQVWSGSCVQGHVLVSVLDNGPGFREEDVSRIFSAFYTTKDSGLGMGLSICRSIIDAHGGRIWAEPGSPGAHFYIELRCSNEGES